jgi:hypothetical protein
VADTVGTLVKWGLIGGAVYLAYEYFFAAPVTAAPVTTTALLPPPAVTPPPATPPAAPPPTSSYDTAAALFTRITALAQADNVTQASQSPDAWNVYFVNAGGPQIINGSLPDPTVIFGSHNPVTLAQWWAATSAWLATNKGLTGLAVYAGLGRLAFGRGLGRW